MPGNISVVSSILLSLNMQNDDARSLKELKLREWLAAQQIYPDNDTMQSLVINSFYSASEEETEADDLLSPEDGDVDDEAGENIDFDYKQFESSDEEEEQEWRLRIDYALNNPDKLLAYVNANWRFESE